VPGDWPWSSGDDHCIGGALPGTQELEGDPINTRTGNYDYSVTDLSIPTSAGPLVFHRWYGSRATEFYTSTLGYGWTHSLDTRLVFPDDPGGREGVVLLKAHSANLYEFTILPNGTFLPYPGMCGELTRQTEPSVKYIFTDNDQWQYVFNEQGRLTELINPQGSALHFEYENGLLVSVSDDTETRYINLTYDEDDRLLTVSDHISRTVSFGYDIETGDLLTVTDVLEQDWTYVYTGTHLLDTVLIRGYVVGRTEYDDQGAPSGSTTAKASWSSG
jgi:YD repeat-containing protein